MKLIKLAKDFHQAHLQQKIASEMQDYAVMRSHLDEFFPSRQLIESFATVTQLAKDNDCSGLYSMVNLPFHTRNNAWLTEYLRHRLLHLSETTTTPLVKEKNIASFVKHDPDFDAERNRYERDLTCTQIKFYLNEDTDSNTPARIAFQNQIKNSINADYDFRQMILTQLTAIGLDQHSVEVGLETSNAWRKQTMELAFANRYIYPLLPTKKYVAPETYTYALNKVALLEPQWMALREYHYYHENKNIIDELGLANKNMKMHPDVAATMANAWKNHYHAITEPLFNNVNLISDNHNLDFD